METVTAEEISIHAPAKGATPPSSVTVIMTPEFQSTLPRRERRRRTARWTSSRRISIHAPAKGATENDGADRDALLFQSTLPRRERPASSGDTRRVSTFQSTLPRRERRRPRHTRVRPRRISIHAPAKGATQPGCGDVLGQGISIHAPAKGATSAPSTICIFPAFQSTLPRRERPISSTPALTPTNFNPRSREGSDVPAEIADPTQAVFQSTLPRRERLKTRVCPVSASVFQSTLPRRERQQKSPRLSLMIFTK